jgi:hypothetical protein
MALLAGGVEPAIAEHGGRIVKNTGDGFLAEFPSAVEAVRAAVQFQTSVHELTTGESEDRRIAFRVGVNIGDVIVEPHDIFGDGVNIAARLESIAEPGGICVSSAAYDQVRGKAGVEFADLGEQNLKNIAVPVRAFAVVQDGPGAAAQERACSKSPQTRRRRIARGSMTFRISQRGKQYLETVRTLLRAAQTMTDQAVASQLKALADGYERRAEQARMLMRPKHWYAPLLTRKASGVHDPMASSQPALREKCSVT